MKKIIYIFLVFSSSFLFAAKSHPHCKPTTTKADKYAWAKDYSLETINNSIWPYKALSIGNSMQSYQNYGSPYWHDGLDIRGAALENVFSSVDGKVVNIEKYGRSDLYWEVAILDDYGFVWKYHHVDKNTISKDIYKKLKNGTKVKQGEFIGKVVTWPVSSYREVFHHIHLLIVDGNGHYINPFTMLPKLLDISEPVIKKIGLFKNLKPIKTDKVRGAHGLYIEAYDTVLHKDFLLTPYLIKYTLDNKAERVVWRFDKLPDPKSDLTYINQFYLKGTCGNYTCRKFYINLNFDINEPKATKYFKLKKGIHNISVTVEDFIGNSTTKNYSYQVY